MTANYAGQSIGSSRLGKRNAEVIGGATLRTFKSNDPLRSGKTSGGHGFRKGRE